MSKIKIINAGLLLTLLTGCASFGPINTAEFAPKIRQDIPTIDGKILEKSHATFLPGINGYNLADNFFEAGPLRTGKAGAIVVTDQRLYFVEWKSEKYQLLWDLDYRLIKSIEIRSMGRGKRLVVCFNKSPEVASFDITSDGTFIDAKTTTAIGQLIARQSGKTCKLP